MSGASLSADDVQGDTLRVSFSGDWLLEHGLPGPDPVLDRPTWTGTVVNSSLSSSLSASCSVYEIVAGEPHELAAQALASGTGLLLEPTPP